MDLHYVQVAGLISYFQGLPNPPVPPDAQDYEQKMYNYLANTASRQLAGTDGPRVVWNLNGVVPNLAQVAQPETFETA